MKAIFITVRTGSSRLPKKAILKINGKSTIEYVIDSAKQSKLADKIILCTTTLPEDDQLCKIAINNKIDYFRGSIKDKLQRWNDAADKFGVDFFVTADGDDLFCSYELMDLAFQQYDENGSDFIEGDRLVSGSFTYGISTGALKRACDIKDTDDTEMMWVYFTKTGICNIEKLLNVPEIYLRNDIRMTLDYQEDFNFFETIIHHFGNTPFTTRDVLRLIDQNNHIKDINYFLEDRWKQNQIVKTELVVKE